MKKQNKNYNTNYSQVISHPSTKFANTRLTSEIGRDPVELVCMVVAEKYTRYFSYKPVATIALACDCPWSLTGGIVRWMDVMTSFPFLLLPSLPSLLSSLFLFGCLGSEWLVCLDNEWAMQSVTKKTEDDHHYPDGNQPLTSKHAERG